MGVRSLSSFVTSHESTKTYKFSNLKNKIIAVDSGVFLYNWMKMANQMSLQSRIEGKTEDSPQFHWEWHCIHNLDLLRQYKIQMIFLFDSGHPDEKQETIDQRKQKKERAQVFRDRWMELYRTVHSELQKVPYNQYHVRKLKASLNDDMMQMLSLMDENSIKASGNDYETMKKLIQLNGLRWIECPQEAEYVGVDMVHHGMADYVMSNDSDCIACQCDNYITNFDWQNQTYDQVNVKDMIRIMRITPDQFRIACCCMGNDYMESLWDSSIYWNRVRQFMVQSKLRVFDDMVQMYPDQKSRMDYCWKLYKRVNRNSQDMIKCWLKGNGRVSPRQIEKVRETGICV